MPHAQKTQPALRTQFGAQSQDFFALRLTIVYHPNTARIGAFSDLLTWPATAVQPDALLLNEPPRARFAVGRQAPDFSDGIPLLEPHVSRAALRLSLERDILRLEVIAGADGRLGAQASQSLLASAEQREAGLPIRLGHGVVLWLRQIQLRGDECGAGAQTVAVAGCAEPDTDAYAGPGVDAHAASVAEPSADAIPDVLLPGSAIETQRLRRLIKAVAASDLPAMILGESGVGKELVAQAIHQQSARAAQPMVAVNVAAIPDTLAASELFGAAKGAFTGAQLRQGYFQAADGGTLFLDEIGDTPVTLQTQLLRALQQGEVQVVGGRPTSVDVRVVAATDAKVDGNSQFRHALRQRLSAFSVEILPLRKRLEDIGPIARHILARDDLAPTLSWVDAATDPELAAHWARLFFYWLCETWPGNVREFSQQLQRAAAGDDWVAPTLSRAVCESLGNEKAEALALQRRDINDEEIAAAYRSCEFEVSATADRLSVSRQFLYRRIPLIPGCRLASDVSDEQLRTAIASVGIDPVPLGRLLEVSARALRARLKRMQLL